MCIMFFDKRTKDSELVPRKWMKRAFEIHSHGMGLMYPQEGKLHVWRTMDDIKGLMDRYEAAAREGFPVAVHFRRATEKDGKYSDDKNPNIILENTHPFEVVPEKLGMMHNGTIHAISNLKPLKDDITMSDTRYFVDQFLSRVPDLMDNMIYHQILDKVLGFDRMLFLNSEAYYLIFNDKSNGAYWSKGVWWSHDKDRDYIETGVVKKQPTLYSVGGVFGTEYHTSDYCTKESTKIAGKYAFFDYGLFGDELMLALGGTFHTIARLDRHPLYAKYATVDKLGAPEPAVFLSIPVPEHKNSAAQSCTYGTVWLVDEETLDELTANAPKHYWITSERVVALGKENLKIPANVLLHYAQSNVTAGSWYTNQLALVPTGDWGVLQKSIGVECTMAEIHESQKTTVIGTLPSDTPVPQTEPKKIVKLTPREDTKSETPFPISNGGSSARGVATTRVWKAGAICCPYCKGSNTATYVVTQGTEKGEQYVWCNTCHIDFEWVEPAAEKAKGAGFRFPLEN